MNQHERDALDALLDHIYEESTLSEGIAPLAEKLCEAARRTEREACALVCEQVTAAWSEIEYNEGCMDCSKAIRARGDA